MLNFHKKYLIPKRQRTILLSPAPDQFGLKHTPMLEIHSIDCNFRIGFAYPQMLPSRFKENTLQMSSNISK